MPSAGWLSVGWMPKTMAFVEKEIKIGTTVPATLAVPLVKKHFPPNANEQFLRIWNEREIFLKALDRLPQTFAHQDGVSRNLFARLIGNDQYETIATDWAFAGQAAIGLDAAMPVIIDVFLGDLDSSKAEAYDKLVFNGYVTGLQDAGWNGSEKQVRLGYTAATALKYLELICALTIFKDESKYAWIEKSWGNPAAEIIDMFAGMHRYVCKLADEARKLA